MSFSGDEIGGHARERYREIVEACDLRVGKCNVIEDEINFLSGIKSRGELQSVAQTKFKLAGDLVGVFFLSKRQVTKRRDSAQHLIPIDPVDELSNFRRRSASCVDSPDQTAHAGACDVANGDSV